MCIFKLNVGGMRSSLALVAAHGATDADSLRFVGPYAAALLVPMPSSVITALFCFASLVHLSDDFGTLASVFVHATALATGILKGKNSAAQFMVRYLMYFHTPAHYMRCLNRGRRRAVCASAAASALSLCLSRRFKSPTFELGHGAQRVAVAHIIHEFTMKTNP